eukprot:4613993-Pyramimonas_sp.AAC.1
MGKCSSTRSERTGPAGPSSSLSLVMGTRCSISRKLRTFHSPPRRRAGPRPEPPSWGLVHGPAEQRARLAQDEGSDRGVAHGCVAQKSCSVGRWARRRQRRGRDR